MNVKFVIIIPFQILQYRCVTVYVLSIFLATHTHHTHISVYFVHNYSAPRPRARRAKVGATLK